MLKDGAVRRCKPGAADAIVADGTHEEESRDAPAPGASGAYAPGATSPCRSGGKILPVGWTQRISTIPGSGQSI